MYEKMTLIAICVTNLHWSKIDPKGCQNIFPKYAKNVSKWLTLQEKMTTPHFTKQFNKYIPKHFLLIFDPKFPTVWILYSYNKGTYAICFSQRQKSWLKRISPCIFQCLYYIYESDFWWGYLAFSIGLRKTQAKGLKLLLYLCINPLAIWLDSAIVLQLYSLVH